MFETILVPLDGSEVGGRRAKLGPRPLRLRAVEPLSRRLAQPPAIFEAPAAAAANVELLEKMTAAEREEAQTYLEALRPRLERGGGGGGVGVGGGGGAAGGGGARPPGRRPAGPRSFPGGPRARGSDQACGLGQRRRPGGRRRAVQLQAV